MSFFNFYFEYLPIIHHAVLILTRHAVILVTQIFSYFRNALAFLRHQPLLIFKTYTVYTD